MTTLHVREDAAARGRRAVPVDQGLRRRRRLPAQALDRRARARAGRRDPERRRPVAASGDGLVLRGMRARGLPTLRVRATPAGKRVTDRADARRARRGRRRAARVARAHRAPVVRPARPDARPARRPGPRLRLRHRRPSQVGRGRPRARRSELGGRHLPRPAGARTRGRGRPRTGRAGGRAGGRPQTLKLRSRVGLLSTRSRDLGVMQDVLRSYPRVDRNAEMAVTCENPNHVERRGTLDSY